MTSIFQRQKERRENLVTNSRNYIYYIVFPPSKPRNIYIFFRVALSLSPPDVINYPGGYAISYSRRCHIRRTNTFDTTPRVYNVSVSRRVNLAFQPVISSHRAHTVLVFASSWWLRLDRVDTHTETVGINPRPQPRNEDDAIHASVCSRKTVVVVANQRRSRVSKVLHTYRHLNLSREASKNTCDCP